MKHIIYLITICFFLGLPEVKSQTMSLEQCKQMALEKNASVGIKQEQLRQANALKKAAYTQYFPSLGFTGTYIRMNKPFQLFDSDIAIPVLPADFYDPSTGSINQSLLTNPSMMPLAFVINPETGYPYADVNGNPIFQQYAWMPSDQLSFGEKNNYLLNAGLTQPLYMGGKIRQLNKMASIAEEIAVSSLSLEQQKIIEEVEELYWNLITLQEKNKLAKHYKDLLIQIISDVESYKSEGIVLNNDLLKAKMKLNEAELNIMKTDNGISVLRKVLCIKIGIPIDGFFNPADTIIPDSLYFFTAGEISNSALNNRQELKMLENNVLLAKSGVKMMQSRFLPDIVFTANYSYMNPNPYAGFTKTFGSDYNLGIAMHVPIFHFGERRHTLTAARSQQTIANLQLEETQQMLVVQSEMLVGELNECALEMKMSMISLEYAEENLKKMNDLYEEGMCKIADLLEAQVLWQEAVGKNIDARAEYRKKLMSVLKAGGMIN